MQLDHQSLDLNKASFRSLLDKGTELVLRQFDQLETKKAYHDYKQAEVYSWFDESLPEEGMEIDDLLEELSQKVLEPATGNLGPHMYGYVMAGGTQISLIAEQLAATINQNIGKWHLAPSITEIEQRVVKWGSEMIGYTPEAGGVVVTGGSAANLAGLTVGRNLFFEKYEIRKKGIFGQKPFRVYASKEVHGCVDKSIEILGIGTDNLIKLPIDEEFRIIPEAVEAQIKKDLAEGYQPFCIVGNAGTVNTGAIDDLERLAQIARKYELWYHVDGAYGGLAAAIPAIRPHYNGIEKADSVAIDYHKWLYQPFEAGCVLVRNWEALRSAYYKKADYLDTSLELDKGRRSFNEHHFQLSRNAKSLKVWLSIKGYGFARFRDMIQKDIDLTHYLADQTEKLPDFRLKSKSKLAVACFQYTGGLTDDKAIEQLNKSLIPALEKDGRVFITGTRLNGEFVIRACLINHRKTEASTDYLLQVIREVGEEILTSQKVMDHS